MMSDKFASFDELPKGAKIGTTSLRRKMQLLKMRPDLEVISLRGNVQTRLKKLKEGNFDAIILAMAGINRLNLKDEVRSLSKGNVAKLNLLLGMGLDTDYILMDEPFSGIDVFTREEIARVFTSDLLDGRGVLITTHEINDIEYIVDKAVLLNDGRVVKEFYPEEVREEEGKSIVDVMREVYLP